MEKIFVFSLAKLAKIGCNSFSEKSVNTITIATATEVQNNFGRLLKIAQGGGEAVILKNNAKAARPVSKEKPMPFLLDELVDMLFIDEDEKGETA